MHRVMLFFLYLHSRNCAIQASLCCVNTPAATTRACMAVIIFYLRRDSFFSLSFSFIYSLIQSFLQSDVIILAESSHSESLQ